MIICGASDHCLRERMLREPDINLKNSLVKTCQGQYIKLRSISMGYPKIKNRNTVRAMLKLL